MPEPGRDRGGSSHVMKKPKSSRPRPPRGRRGGKADAADMNQATTEEFEREDMGVAPKE
jgi:hypothetical protein